MNLIRRIETSSKLFLFIILLNFISFLHVSIFSIYNSFAFYGNLILLLFIFVIQNKIHRHELDILLYIILFISYGLLTIIITNGGLGSVITPVFSIFVFWITKRCKINNEMLKILTIALIGVNLFWIINSFGYYEKFLLNKNESFNTNTIGMILMYSAIYISIFIKQLNWKGSIIIPFIVYILSGWAILNCQSRGSFIALIMFVVFDTLIPKYFWKNKVRMLVVTFGIIFVGLLIPYIYTGLYNQGIDYVIPYTSKTLYTGREAIWNNFYNEIGESNLSMIFGLGSNADLWTGHNLNLHNNYLGVIANFGVIGFVMYYGFWINQIIKIYKRTKINNYQLRLLLGFLSVLIEGFIEISTLWHIMFFFNFMFLGLAFNDHKSEFVVKNDINTKSLIQKDYTSMVAIK